MSRVEVLRSQIAGAATLEISIMRGATAQATVSGLRRANCLGTNSPMTMEKKVIRPMTMPKPRGSARPGGTPVRQDWVSRAPRAAPEKAPARIPTRVMPIWTVERNVPESSISFRAVRAPGRPFSAMALRRGRRAETMASSDRAKTPLRAMRQIATMSSNNDLRSCRPHQAAFLPLL